MSRADSEPLRPDPHSGEARAPARARRRSQAALAGPQVHGAGAAGNRGWDDHRGGAEGGRLAAGQGAGSSDQRYRSTTRGILTMPQPNYRFDKRQRELARQKKQEEKRLKKEARKAANAPADQPEPAAAPTPPEQTS